MGVCDSKFPQMYILSLKPEPKTHTVLYGEFMGNKGLFFRS